MNRYDRQERVNGWNQNNLLDSEVAIVGAGALGTVVALQLACLGIGRIDIFDFDEVEDHNLNRQFLYFDSIGKNKAMSLVAKLRYINPDIEINAFNTKFVTMKDMDSLKGYDIIFDCTDNWDVRKLINKFVYKNKIKFIHGGMKGFEGQIQCIDSSKKTACLECLPIPDNDKKPSAACEIDPAIITTSFTIGSLMAQEGVKMLMFPADVFYGLVTYTGFTEDLGKIKLKKNKKCKVCSKIRRR